MAEWTTPRTWEIGWMVAASDLNTHLRDNLLTLAEGNGIQAESTSTITITATGMADTGLSLTLTSKWGGRMLFNYSSFVMAPSAGYLGYLALRINDITEPYVFRADPVATNGGIDLQYVHFSWLSGNLDKGTSYTFKVRGYVTGNNMRLYAVAQMPIRYSLVEI